MTNKYVVMLEYCGHVHEMAHDYIYVFTITPKHKFYDKHFVTIAQIIHVIICRMIMCHLCNCNHDHDYMIMIITT
jgi:hypothetical protein